MLCVVCKGPIATEGTACKALKWLQSVYCGNGTCFYAEPVTGRQQHMPRQEQQTLYAQTVDLVERTELPCWLAG